MAEVTVSRQKAEYISHEVITRGKSEYVQLKYKRLDGENPGAQQTTGAFVSKLDKDSRDRIKAGGTFVVVKTKEGEYWNLTSVDDITTYSAKAPSTYTGGGGQKSYAAKASASTYNTAGIKVGAVLHDAVAVYAADGGAPSGVSAKDCIRTIAEELLSLSYELEANVNAGKYEAKAAATKETKEVRSKAIKEAVIEDSYEDLENIEF